MVGGACDSCSGKGFSVRKRTCAGEACGHATIFVCMGCTAREVNSRVPLRCKLCRRVEAQPKKKDPLKP